VVHSNIEREDKGEMRIAERTEREGPRRITVGGMDLPGLWDGSGRLGVYGELG